MVQIVKLGNVKGGADDGCGGNGRRSAVSFGGSDCFATVQQGEKDSTGTRVPRYLSWVGECVERRSGSICHHGIEEDPFFEIRLARAGDASDGI